MNCPQCKLALSVYEAEGSFDAVVHGTFVSAKAGRDVFVAALERAHDAAATYPEHVAQCNVCTEVDVFNATNGWLKTPQKFWPRRCYAGVLAMRRRDADA